MITDEDRAIMKAAKPDFIGFNYYNTATVAASDGTESLNPSADQQTARGEAGFYRGVDNPNLPKTEFGWEIDPVGFRATVREMYSRYRLPLLVTENGLGAYDTLTEDGKVHDQYRIDYLRAHIEQIQFASTDGVDMLGYNPWSANDLISTHEGIRKHYGSFTLIVQMKKLVVLNVTAKIHSSGIKKLSQATDKICQIKIRKKYSAILLGAFRL